MLDFCKNRVYSAVYDIIGTYREGKEMSMELTFAKNRITELEGQIAYTRSATLTLLLDLQVMLEDGEYDEALEFVKGHTTE